MVIREPNYENEGNDVVFEPFETVIMQYQKRNETERRWIGFDEYAKILFPDYSVDLSREYDICLFNVKSVKSKSTINFFSGNVVSTVLPSVEDLLNAGGVVGMYTNALFNNLYEYNAKLYQMGNFYIFYEDGGVYRRNIILITKLEADNKLWLKLIKLNNVRTTEQDIKLYSEVLRLITDYDALYRTEYTSNDKILDLYASYRKETPLTSREYKAILNNVISMYDTRAIEYDTGNLPFVVPTYSIKMIEEFARNIAFYTQGIIVYSRDGSSTFISVSTDKNGVTRSIRIKVTGRVSASLEPNRKIYEQFCK